jgi:glycerate kinase
MTQALDKGMLHFAQIIHKNTGKDIKSIPGSGAAGGIGGGMLAFLNCELKKGAKILLDISEFHNKIIDANLIITGEGKIDKQTLMGKIPYHILQEGIKKRIPVIAIAGKVENKQDLIQAGFKAIYQITPDFMNLEEAIKPEVVTKNIQKVVNNLASTYLKSFI